MKAEYIKKIREIAEEAFGIEDLSIECRQRLFINARSWYFKSCHELEKDSIWIRHREAAGELNKDHTSSLHAVVMYETYYKYDGFNTQHDSATKQLNAFVFGDVNKPKQMNMIENKYLIEWIKETYPTMLDCGDNCLCELDYFDMDKFAEWLVKKLSIPDVVVPEGTLCDFDGKQVMVRFKVTKHIPKIVIDDI